MLILKNYNQTLKKFPTVNMETLIENAEAARKKGYITLALLRDVLVEDGQYARRDLESLYDRYGCKQISQKEFSEILDEASATDVWAGSSFDNRAGRNYVYVH